MSFPCVVEMDTTRYAIAQATAERAIEAEIESAEKMANKWNCPFCDEFGTAMVEQKSMFDEEWLVKCEDCGGQTGFYHSPYLASMNWIDTFKRRIQ